MLSLLRVETLFAGSAHQGPVCHGFILKDNAHPCDVKLGWIINTQAGLAPVLVLVEQHVADSSGWTSVDYLNEFRLRELHIRYLYVYIFSLGDSGQFGEQDTGS